MAHILIIEDNTELGALVASAAQNRGHTATVAHTGQAGLDALEKADFDAAVVDLLLPDLSGAEVLAELKRRSIPALVVSGVYKGARFAKEATEVHGALAFFEKPFDLQTLLTSLETILGQPAEVHDPPAEGDDGIDIDIVEELEPQVESGLELPFGQRTQVWASSGEGPPSRPSVELVRSGSLKTSPVPRLLTAYYQAGHSGELKLQRGNVVKLVLFFDGHPGYAASNGSRERFGPFCIEQGALEPAQLLASQNLAREEGLGVAQAAIRLGFLTDEQRQRLVEEQIRTIVWSTFSWEEGTFEFVPQRPHRPNLLKISLSPASLILEGTLRVEPLVSLRRKIASSRRLFPAADPPYPLHELMLSNGQALLLAHTDGSKTVEDLVTLSDLSEREALATLRGLELLGILMERPEHKTRRRITFGI